MVYVNEGALKQFHEDVAAFIRSTAGRSKSDSLFLSPTKRHDH